MGVRGTGRVGRRGFLGRALLLGGTGALGAAVGGSATTAAAAELPPSLRRVTLLGESWHVLGEPGAAPAPGLVPLTAGTLTSATGSAIGEFRSARLGSATLLHQWEFSDGTIFGLGQGGLADANFALVGGTGQYAGTSGGYTARQHPSELGGSGTASFELSLLPASSASWSQTVLGALMSTSSVRS